jgi:hypothetical protein
MAETKIETKYRTVLDPVLEGNPAPIANPENDRMPCLGNCGGYVDSLDGLCTDCWMLRHDARLAEGRQHHGLC